MKIIGQKLVKSFDLTSPAAVARDGGTITGALSFDREKGAYFDGSNDYVAYNIDTLLFGSSPYAVVVEHVPDSSFGDSGVQYIYSSTSNNNAFWKNGASSLRVNAGGTLVSAFTANWTASTRVIHTFVADSGNNEFYADEDATSDLAGNSATWSPTLDTAFYIGATATGTNKYAGWIKSIKVYHVRMDQPEAAGNVFTKSEYNFMNKADVWLDMRSVRNDGANSISKDRSGKGNDFLRGDGTTASTLPTFVNPGEDLDGSSDYLSKASVGFLNNTYQTFVICFNPDFADDGGSYYFFQTGGTEYSIAKGASDNMPVILGGTTVIAGGANPSSNWLPYWKAHGTNVIVVTGTSGDTDLYLNGFPIISGDITAWTPATPTSFYLGSTTAPGAYFDGTIYHFSSYGSRFAQKMTPQQARYLTETLTNKYS